MHQLQPIRLQDGLSLIAGFARNWNILKGVIPKARAFTSGARDLPHRRTVEAREILRSA